MSFIETKVPEKYKSKVVITGNPIREWILNGDAGAGHKLTGFDEHRPVVLIMGGSQGATQINELVRESLDELLKKFQIVHVVGRGNLDIGVRFTGYRQFEFLNEELKNVYAMSEMVVTRGGANSLFEIALLRKKALIIPIGKESSRGDQVDNARVFVRELGWGLISGDVSASQFIKALEMAFRNKVNKSEKFKNGTAKVVDMILNFKK